MTNVPKQKTPEEWGKLVVKFLALAGPETAAHIWNKVWKECEEALPKADMKFIDIANMVDRAFKRKAANPGWSWHNINDLIEKGIAHDDLKAFAQKAYDRGREDQARASASNGNGSGNGGGFGPGFWVPDTDSMVAHCKRQASQLKNSNDQNFVGEMYQGKTFTRAALGYLISIFVKTDGNVRKT